MSVAAVPTPALRNDVKKIATCYTGTGGTKPRSPNITSAYKHNPKVAIRKYATSGKLKVIPDENMLKDIDDNVFKPRNHPGILKPRTVAVPDAFVKAVTNVTEDYPVKSLIEDGKILNRHLKCKVAPLEKEDIRNTRRLARERVLGDVKEPVFTTDEDKLKFEQIVADRVKNILQKEVYNWKPVDYDVYKALVYLMARSAAEYAVLVKIFSEIAERDVDFKPRSLFDFGSGVGTVTWAANLYWKSHIYEYFNVDASVEMNDLAEILLKGGRGTNQATLKGVFFRQFLPASNISYDLVVSAYTLLELPSQQTRLDTILNLWNKTQRYLVVVEQGSNAGFQVVNEIRDFILHSRSTNRQAHIFSPCPHDEVCPRFLANDNTPCNFEVNYHSLPVDAASERRHERYCYVVFKKGERSAEDPQWPRMVRPALVRSKHTICRMCTKDGQLEEVIFTASKHGKQMYHCARATKWGDLLPVTLEKRSSDGDKDQS